MTLSATGTYRIAAVPGDGIGKETVAAARKVLDVVAQNEGFTLNWIEYPWGCDYYFEAGRMTASPNLPNLMRFCLERLVEPMCLIMFRSGGF
jgi:tartrate dehydrogenase/decarboxylase/D-malate dehydrogenase